MHKFAYTVVDDRGSDVGELVVATTRLETMLGDSAVAIHPDDIRYKVFTMLCHSLSKHLICY